jgi:proteasome lid subunit RPN8/RPN11
MCDRHFVEKMKTHAGQTYPEECCGILLGKSEADSRIVYEVMAIDNSSEQLRTRRFIITPEDYRTAETQAGKNGLEILGFYHSHPDHPARPSQFDLEHAFPSWSYVIIGVDHGQPATMSSWILRDDRSRFEAEVFEVPNSQENAKSD